MHHRGVTTHCVKHPVDYSEIILIMSYRYLYKKSYKNLIIKLIAVLNYLIIKLIESFLVQLSLMSHFYYSALSLT